MNVNVEKILKHFRIGFGNFFDNEILNICFFFGFDSIENHDADVHDMHADDMEQDEEIEEEDDEHDEKLSMEGRKLRKRSHQPFFCEDDGDSSAPENDDDLDDGDADGPENLCIKNTRDPNSDGVSNNNNNKDNSSSGNNNSNNNNRIGLGELYS